MQGIGFTEFLEDLDEAPGPAIPDWVWNSHTRAATRTCLARWWST